MIFKLIITKDTKMLIKVMIKRHRDKDKLEEYFKKKFTQSMRLQTTGKRKIS